MSIVWLLVGVVIGVFLPLPYGEMVRQLVLSGWAKVREWFSR